MGSGIATAQLIVTLATLPFVCSWRLALSFFSLPERNKTWRRVVFDSIPRWFTTRLTIPQLVGLVGTSEELYKSWTKKNGLPSHIESLEENAKLLWIGRKEAQRVILFLHGGGFSTPMTEDSITFWRYVQTQMGKSGVDVSVAVLDYTLIPQAHFPVPLRQTVAAINHLLQAGIKPSSIIVTGDSAGGNLALQLLLHMKTPIKDLPQIAPETKFGGVYLMSPWCDILLRRPTRSNVENVRWDIISSENLRVFGQLVSDGIKEEAHLPYVDAHFAPDGWYDGFEEVAETMLISAGELECLRDDILLFSEKVCKTHPRAQVVLDKNGIHDDPFFNFLAGEKNLGTLTPKIVDWCLKCFST